MMNPTTSTMNIPQTQNTAPVLEFRCLYTQDLRRKQKRWQDGRLKFHTFNKRVMVYDERSNFVGDTHWKGSDFDEGEEFELERRGIMVEVGEFVGKRDQDLSELIDKRVKEREERIAAKAAASPAHPQTPIPDSGLLRPKTLNAVIGTPTGRYGRAMVSNLSPFEKKQQVSQDENGADRAVKRRKQDEPPSGRNGYAQNLMGATLTLAPSRPPSTANIRYEPLRPSLQRLQANTIDLTDDGRNGAGTHHSDVSKTKPASGSPPRIQKRKTSTSPPSKRGYASNLTGTVLSFSRPAIAFSAGHHTQECRRLPPRIEGQYLNSSTAQDILPCEKSKTSRPSTRMGQESNSEDATSSLSPDQTVDAPVMSKSVHLVSQYKSISSIPERVVSTLRIKARAPRKMMMLLDHPSSRSRSSIPRDSLAQRDIVSKQTQTPTVAAIELRQNTKREDSFYQKSDEDSSINMDIAPSSPVDKGIDHHTIDSLLGRPRTIGETGEALPHSRSDSQKSLTEVDKIVRCGKSSAVELGNVSGKGRLSNSATISLAAAPVVSTRMKDIAPLEKVGIDEKQPAGEQAQSIPDPALVAVGTNVPAPVMTSEPPIVYVRRSSSRLVNPATGGPSLRSLAKQIVDTTGPTIINKSPPPLPKVTEYHGRSSRVDAGQIQILTGPVAEGGPWSRESFDLFGTWRPPGRELANKS